MFHLVKEMVPLNTVEKDGLKKMVKTLDPRYALPDQKYFSTIAIPAMYTELKEKLQIKLATVLHYSTSANRWSSRTIEPYLNLTIYFINDEWELQSHCLQTNFLPKDHTAKLIAEGLLEAFES